MDVEGSYWVLLSFIWVLLGVTGLISLNELPSGRHLGTFWNIPTALDTTFTAPIGFSVLKCTFYLWKVIEKKTNFRNFSCDYCAFTHF